MTREQRQALTAKWSQADEGLTLEDFIRSAQDTVLMDGAIVVKWCGMWLAIETDGYCHS